MGYVHHEFKDDILNVLEEINASLINCCVVEASFYEGNCLLDLHVTGYGWFENNVVPTSADIKTKKEVKKVLVRVVTESLNKYLVTEAQKVKDSVTSANRLKAKLKTIKIKNKSIK